MPRYEFRCRVCTTVFEVDRPMSAAGEDAACPAGHADTVKLLSTVAIGGRTGAGAKSSMSAGAAQTASSAARGTGGCCGGGHCG